MRALVIATLFVGACAHETHKAPPAGEEQPAATTGAAPAGAPTEAQEASGVQVAPTTQTPAGTAPAAPPPKIKVIVRLAKNGPDKALVFWGKKKLGETPVTLERPRDSGPVDLVVRGEGFFPVHTRAYTFHNDVLYVRMTKLEDRMTLFGAKRDVNEAPPGGAPDGGTAAPAGTIPPPAP
ncbi:MAG TPA: hypothetical protein VGH63_19150 [Polyangia bacterium]